MGRAMLCPRFDAPCLPPRFASRSAFTSEYGRDAWANGSDSREAGMPHPDGGPTRRKVPTDQAIGHYRRNWGNEGDLYCRADLGAMTELGRRPGAPPSLTVRRRS